MSEVHYRGVPKSVRIGCYVFKVEIEEFEDSEASSSFGHMNPINQKIRLRQGMNPHNLANTFIHEVLHGIHWFLGCGNDSHESRGSEVEEEYTLKGANGLCTFWQDNPLAVKWWQKTVTEGFR